MLAQVSRLDAQLVALAERSGLAVGIVVDPTAAASERWIASLGLDEFAAGETPADALVRLAEQVDARPAA